MAHEIAPFAVPETVPGTVPEMNSCQTDSGMRLGMQLFGAPWIDP